MYCIEKLFFLTDIHLWLQTYNKGDRH